MITLKYQGFYANSVAYRILLCKRGYRIHDVRVELPGEQYLEAISAEFHRRGFGRVCLGEIPF